MSMIKRGWSKEAVGKYVMVQIPPAALAGIFFWILWNYGILSTWLAWVCFALWIVKDVVLFFFLWPAYEPTREAGRFSPVGLQGVARSDLQREGLVKVKGEIWRARPQSSCGPIRAGEKVKVVDRQGLKLIVRPD